jgi:hypothetical protein
MHKLPEKVRSELQTIIKTSVCAYSVEQSLLPVTLRQTLDLGLIQDLVLRPRNMITDPVFLDIREVWLGKSTALIICDAVWADTKTMRVAITLTRSKKNAFEPGIAYRLPDEASARSITKEQQSTLPLE